MRKIIYQDEKSRQRALWRLCQEFVDKRQISCAETIYQSDDVIENAYEFIEQICELVGYYDAR